MQGTSPFGTMDGLPDPELDRAYYDGVARRRLAAWVIDLIVILIIGVPFALVFGLLTLGFGFALFPLIVAGIGFFYRIATITGASATMGMRIMGIEFRRADGERFDLVTAFLHTLLFTLAFGFLVLQMISCIAMIGTRHGQSLPDLILRTTAINRPAD